MATRPIGRESRPGVKAPPARSGARHRARSGPRHAKGGRRERRSFAGPFIDGGFIAVCVLIFGLLVRTFLAQLYTVPSGSMENTLRIGDTVVVSRLTPEVLSLRRGDIIVFRDPGGWLPAEDHAGPQGHSFRAVMRSALVFIGLIPQSSGEHLVKRVIGLAGDTVECDGKSGLRVNRVRLTEKYVYAGDRQCDSPFRVTVPRDGIWVMGDHRSDSADSRYHRNINDGAVPTKSVVGKVIAVSHNGHLSLL